MNERTDAAMFRVFKGFVTGAWTLLLIGVGAGLIAGWTSLAFFYYASCAYVVGALVTFAARFLATDA